MSVAVDAPPSVLERLRARGAASGASFEEAWCGWRAAARARAREAAIASVARASGRPLEDVRAILLDDGPDRRALIARAAGSHLSPVDRGIVEALGPESGARGDALEIASALASLGCGLPVLLLEHPSLTRLAWALRAVEACPALPVVACVSAREAGALERELPRSLADRMRAGILSPPAPTEPRVRDSIEPRFRDAAGTYGPALAALEPVWREALGAMRDDGDGARSLAERLLFLALEALPETRGLFALNETLPGVRFGPRDVEIDLAALSIGLALEVDGPFHFLDAAAYRRDRRKDALLQRRGLLVVRALASDVVERMADVLDAVVENVRHARGRKENER